MPNQIREFSEQQCMLDSVIVIFGKFTVRFQTLIESFLHDKRNGQMI